MFQCSLLPSLEDCHHTAVVCLYQLVFPDVAGVTGWSCDLSRRLHPPSPGGRWRRESQVYSSRKAPSCLLVVSAIRFQPSRTTANMKRDSLRDHQAMEDVAFFLLFKRRWINVINIQEKFVCDSKTLNKRKVYLTTDWVYYWVRLNVYVNTLDLISKNTILFAIWGLIWDFICGALSMAQDTSLLSAFYR